MAQVCLLSLCATAEADVKLPLVMVHKLFGVAFTCLSARHSLFNSPGMQSPSRIAVVC
jgi:hypothetical protein